MNLKSFISFLSCILLCCLVATSAKAQLTIASNGKSAFTIVIPQKAPSSVQRAAQELQENMKLATGATLSLQNDNQPVTPPYISIGATRQAIESGITATGIADEGYRIVTRQGNLYIIGPDTIDGKWTKGGGTSNGSANGVYTFLEDYLDVRWLMPGTLGRDVPPKNVFILNAVDRSETPEFVWREIPFIASPTFTEKHYRDVSETWEARQKLGASVQLGYNHNWLQTVPPEMFKEHPEWFSMKDGKRVPPVGEYKLETTNPELVRYFAQKAISALKSNERPTTFSLSPSDGRRWSESPESLALYDPVPAGREHPAMSSLVLKWYHDVAQIVAKEYPEGKLAGYLYSDYIFPPTKVAMQLPENFTPVLAPASNYGYRLYREDVQREFYTLLAAWDKVIPGNWYYFDLPNQLWIQNQLSKYFQFSGNTANIAPPGTDILNYAFRGLTQSNIKGAFVYGDPSWSSSALANYIIAKMLWNPKLDANALQTEWLQRAYGPQAGKAMEAFYQKLDSLFRDYYRQHDSDEASYKLTNGMLKDIYAAHYGELENLLLQAARQPMTSVQKQRLELIEKNFIVLQWRLRNINYLGDSFQSAYRRNDLEVARIIEAKDSDLDLFPAVVPFFSDRNTPQIAKLKVKQINIATALPVAKDALELPYKSTFIIHAAQEGKVRIIPRMIRQGSMFATYILLERNAGMVGSGLLIENRPIEFAAKAGENYYLYIPPRNNISYDLQIDGAVAPPSAYDAASGTLSLQDKKAPIYVYGDGRKVNSTPEGVVLATALTLETLQQKYRDVQVTNLDKSWRFLPDAAVNRGVVKPGFKDGSWKIINAQDWWQRQGFPDYHGVAWYRKTFTTVPLGGKQRAVLHFGAVDGKALVFINGKHVGTHRLSSDFSGWDEPFFFDVTDFLTAGENIVAVQVTSKSNDTASGMSGSVNLLLGIPR